MTDLFFKFPSTPHLALSGGLAVRDDKVLANEEREEFLRHELVIEEKIDGANLGISFDSGGNLIFQNRGSILLSPFPGQWKKLPEWIAPRMEGLFDLLDDRLILFGEWCYAKHSVHYTRLPDWFIGFDVFDKENGRFFSTPRRDLLFHQLAIVGVPQIGKGLYSLQGVMDFLRASRFCDHPAEGVYLRYEDAHWLVQRAKLVSSYFSQFMGEDHWSRGGITPNRLTP